jgi:hypothetical protein
VLNHLTKPKKIKNKKITKPKNNPSLSSRDQRSTNHHPVPRSALKVSADWVSEMAQEEMGL